MRPGYWKDENVLPTSLKYGQFVLSLTLVYFFWSPIWIQTTGSILSPGNWRASMIVIQTWKSCDFRWSIVRVIDLILRGKHWDFCFRKKKSYIFPWSKCTGASDSPSMSLDCTLSFSVLGSSWSSVADWRADLSESRIRRELEKYNFI